MARSAWGSARTYQTVAHAVGQRQRLQEQADLPVGATPKCPARDVSQWACTLHALLPSPLARTRSHSRLLTDNESGDPAVNNQDAIEDARAVSYARTKTAGAFCECVEYETIQDEIEGMDILFLGTATGPAVPIGADETGLELFATPFKIGEVLKGRMPKRLKLVHPTESSACGTEFARDREVLWCAYRGRLSVEDEIDATYYTDGCAEPQYTLEEYRRVLG
jgi:hypothetical protein